MYLQHTRPMNNNLMRLFVANPGRYRPLVAFLDQLTQGLSELTWADCETIGAELAQDNGSVFCTGVRRATVDALRGAPGAHPGKLASLVAFARRLNNDASSVSESDVAAVRAHGWSDQTVEDVVGLVAVLRVFSTLATGLGFGAVAPAEFETIGAQTVTAGGYVASFDRFRAAAEPASSSS